MRTKIKKEEKPKNKTYVVCTDNEQRVKGLIVCKDDSNLVVDLPSGFQLTMTRKPKRKLYVFRVGLLEFVSDGWEVC